MINLIDNAFLRYVTKNSTWTIITWVQALPYIEQSPSFDIGSFLGRYFHFSSPSLLFSACFSSPPPPGHEYHKMQSFPTLLALFPISFPSPCSHPSTFRLLHPFLPPFAPSAKRIGPISYFLFPVSYRVRINT